MRCVLLRETKHNYVCSSLFQMFCIIVQRFKYQLIFWFKYISQQIRVMHRNAKQDCIPVGCVPPARWPYLGGGCTCPGGVPARGGVPVQGGCPGGVPAWGVYLGGTCPGGCTWGGVPAWGVYLPGGCTCPGGYLPREGVYLPGGVPAQGGCTCQGGVPARYSPPWTEWQTGVKILPCPNFVCGR